MTDALAGFEETSFEFDGTRRRVFRIGSGPGVVVIHEVPGITPEVAAFARRVADAGCTAVLPHLFGEPGRPISGGYAAGVILRNCVARDFTVFALDRTSPVIGWLRALAREVHQQCGGPGVGVVGMCFTGGFALAAAVDDSVLAPVMSQPSLPFPLTPAQRRDPGLSEKELQRVVQRATDEGLCAMGLRFTGDRAVPSERFATLKQRLGDAFEVIEIDSSPGNEHGFGRMVHSVLTDQVREKDGHPAYEARKRVVEFFKERLVG
jgi:dienelactone hydrolase